MLEKLLEEIRAGGALETHALAAKLGTTPQLVAVMLEHLQRSGLVKNYVKCDDGCGSCGLHDACQGKQQTVRLWQSRLDD